MNFLSIQPDTVRFSDRLYGFDQEKGIYVPIGDTIESPNLAQVQYFTRKNTHKTISIPNFFPIPESTNFLEQSFGYVPEDVEGSEPYFSRKAFDEESTVGGVLRWALPRILGGGDSEDKQGEYSIATKSLKLLWEEYAYWSDMNRIIIGGNWFLSEGDLYRLPPRKDSSSANQESLHRESERIIEILLFRVLGKKLLYRVSQTPLYLNRKYKRKKAA